MTGVWVDPERIEQLQRSRVRVIPPRRAVGGNPISLRAVHDSAPGNAEFGGHISESATTDDVLGVYPRWGGPRYRAVLNAVLVHETFQSAPIAGAAVLGGNEIQDRLARQLFAFIEVSQLGFRQHGSEPIEGRCRSRFGLRTLRLARGCCSRW